MKSSIYSPHHLFSIHEWEKSRGDTLLTLSKEDVDHLRSFNDPIDLDEICRVYLPLSRLLSDHVESSKIIFNKRKQFLNLQTPNKTPFIIGIAGPVAVGKSTIARVLKQLLKRWTSNPKVNLVTTDGFLFPNNILKNKGLMKRKGFPESYDLRKLLKFIADIQSGKEKVLAPRYSHLKYNIMHGEFYEIMQPDILILEGINVLQQQPFPKDGKIIPMVYDFFDFSIYIDADEKLIREWYLDRFIKLRNTAFSNPNSYFNRFTQIEENESRKFAEKIWKEINLQNLKQNILPTRRRANLILRKGKNHLVETIELRKL
ncbi:type I pantothenate kinase [Candidatus Liberibacter sp.]|uniref:type I pantothenate kinase n=1 Tax=Candidatus Liberibacter sp. TaxID=34022 RepID=UPI0015F43DFC|nr:type I pantothenate kinase [Candidatus Liberibacter sp.]MBA5724300.1 type I pantothenate kinase [Candidatus Liberibacter sp.]